MISTFTFIKNNKLDTTLELSDILLYDEHDLIHKAVGWMLREVGKMNMNVLEKFLRPRYRITSYNVCYTKLLRAHPQEANAYIYYGSYLKIVGRNSDALSIYAKALELNEKEETVWQDYLLLLADNKSFDSLYVEGKKAILNFPENSFFYLLTGSASMQLNKNEEANDLFVKGVKSAGENTAMKAQLYAIV